MALLLEQFWTSRAVARVVQASPQPGQALWRARLSCQDWETSGLLGPDQLRTLLLPRVLPCPRAPWSGCHRWPHDLDGLGHTGQAF